MATKFVLTRNLAVGTIRVMEMTLLDLSLANAQNAHRGIDVCHEELKSVLKMI